MKIAAFRAMRRAGLDITGSALRLARDEHPAVRREAALAMRDEPLDTAVDVLVEVAVRYDGEDRYYLEAFGTGATGKELGLYALLKRDIGSDDARQWSDAFADIAWRLHPHSAVDDFVVRAQDEGLDLPQRKQALDALAFIRTRSASEALLTLGQLDTPLKTDAVWWLINRSTNEWQDFGLMAELKERGLYDPAKIEVQEIVTPDPADGAGGSGGPDSPAPLPPVAEILKLEGDPERGKTTAMRCIMCHRVGGQGVDFGPALDGWGKTQTLEVIVRSMVDPSADIAHGFEATEIVTKKGKTVHGLLIQDGNPAIITSMGGVTQMIPRGRIKSKKKMDRSAMLSAAQLGFTAQDVADVAAYLRGN